MRFGKALLAILIAAPAWATSYHVTTTGSTGGTGTQASAWTIAKALGSTGANGTDTVYVHAGIYTGTRVPGGTQASLDIHGDLGGTEAQPTLIVGVADADSSRVIFDGGNGTNSAFQWFSTAAPWIEFRNIEFRNYRGSVCCTGALFRARPGSSVGSCRGLKLSKISLYQTAAIDSVMPLIIVDNLFADTTTVVANRVIVEDCAVTNPGSLQAAIIFDQSDSSVVRNNSVIRSIAGKTPQNQLYGILVSEGRDMLVEGNVVRGCNSGIDATATKRIIIRGNDVQDSQDDGIGVRENSPWSIMEGNYIANMGLGASGGSGMYTESADLTVRGNTAYNCFQSSLWMKTVLGGGTQRPRVYNNLFIHDGDSRTPIDGQAGGSTIAGAYIDHNVYWCTGQTVQFDAGEMTGGADDKTFAQWQALGFDAHGIADVWPGIIDTTADEAVPSSRSVARHAGAWGGTIGARPCGDCTPWTLTASGIDSVRFEIRDNHGQLRQTFNSSALWRDGDLWLADTDLDSTRAAAGTWRGTWRVYDGGEVTDLHDAVTVPERRRTIYR